MLEADQTLRLKALRLAVQAGRPELRQDFYDFLIGNEIRAPRQIIDAAREVANAQ